MRVYDEVRTKFDRRIQEGYGLTEAAPTCTWLRPDDEVLPDSVGRAFNCCEIGIDGSRARASACGRGVHSR